MSRERLGLIERLLRLRRLDEEREAAQLRGHVRTHDEARQRTQEATEAVEALGRWKSRNDARTGLDLDHYRAALAMETQAIDAVESASLSERQARAALDQVAVSHGRAAAATGVTEARHTRLHEQLMREDEMKDSDRLADLRVATRGREP